jgi:hypothetical protein
MARAVSRYQKAIHASSASHSGSASRQARLAASTPPVAAADMGAAVMPRSSLVR